MLSPAAASRTPLAVRSPNRHRNSSLTAHDFPVADADATAAAAAAARHQQQLSSPAAANASSSATALHPSLVEVTALRFDAERRRAVLEQKSKQLARVEADNARLVEALDKIRSSEQHKRSQSEAALLVELDSLKRQQRTIKEENVALSLAKQSLESKVESYERRIIVLRQFEDTNEVLSKDAAHKEGEIARLRQDLMLAEKRIQEAAQGSLCNVLRGKIAALEGMVDDRDASLNELRANCAQLESSLSELRHSHAANHERCDMLEKLVAELRVAMNGLRSDLAASEKLVESQYADFSRRHEDLVGAKGHLEQRCALLEELNGELRAENRETQRRTQDREFVVTELQNELSVTRHELQAARHSAQCAVEDERNALDRMKKAQANAGDRDGQIARQHLLEQNLRAELEAEKHATLAARSDVDRMRQELHDSYHRADLLSHQAAQRDGAIERAQQVERQLQRTLEEGDALREAVAMARRREVDVETALANAREAHALVARLQNDLEARDAQVAELRRDKSLAEAELDALRNDLAHARASAASPRVGYASPQTSPNRRPLASAAGGGATSTRPTQFAFGRHFTPERQMSPPRNARLVVPPAAVERRPQQQPITPQPRRSAPVMNSGVYSTRASVLRQDSTRQMMQEQQTEQEQQVQQQQQRVSAASARPGQFLPNPTVFSPDRPATGRVGPRQQPTPGRK